MSGRTRERNQARLVRCSAGCGALVWLASALPQASDAEFVCSTCADDAAGAEARRLDVLQERLDEETKPYAERRLVVRRVPEYGWAVFDRDSGEKMRPTSPNAWFRKRSTALAAKATEATS